MTDKRKEKIKVEKEGREVAEGCAKRAITHPGFLKRIEGLDNDTAAHHLNRCERKV